ncbi:MAG: RES family NAD+ phosphorylase [Ectothiorhodospiraceae bacterium]|nr:RES family NAD+ phosphorylase [Ectothiorhodospiraceae bacterium]MCH8503960.1 RES family NAD+ phosphorylase [Ectothiorhodospiraceae bacterium]
MADALAQFPVHQVHWPRSYRIVPARFPPVPLFEGIAGHPADVDALNELEGLTSPRLREQAGEIHLLKEEDRRYGPGWSPIMAAICYPRPGRFSDGSFGVYYCADNEQTAVRETRYHRERFMRESNEAPMGLEMRVYIATLNAPLLDLRQTGSAAVPYLKPDDWSASQRLGDLAHARDDYGIVYPSVRDLNGGNCAGVFRPPALGPTHQGKHLQYRWNGERITDVVELRATSY